MSTNQIRILFDKEDRCYCPHDLVSGKVVVDAQTEFTCGGIQISYSWRTHGKGNLDSGGEGSINLANEKLQFLKGDHREFPFRFYAPAGPLTYHGCYVNVDWYLYAKLDIHFLKTIFNGPKFFSTEEDFLLIGDEPPIINRWGEIPDANTSYSSPTESSSSFSFYLRFAGGLLIFLLAFNQFLAGYPAIAILLIIFLVAYIARKKIFNFAFTQKIDIKEVKVEPPTIHPGDRANCCIQFQTKGSVYLDHIAATILIVENAVTGFDTREQSYSMTAYRGQYIKPFGEELAAGRWITCVCPLPIPANAPSSFVSNNNSIKWSIDLKIACKRWPSWEKNIPITVSPR